MGEGGFHSTLCASGTGPTSVGAVPAPRGSERFDGCIMRVACASPIVGRSGFRWFEMISYARNSGVQITKPEQFLE